MRSIGIITCLIMLFVLFIGCSGDKINPVIPQDQNLDQDLPVQGDFEDIDFNMDDYYMPEDGGIDINSDDFDQSEIEYVDINPEDVNLPEDEGYLGDPEYFLTRVVAAYLPPRNVKASDKDSNGYDYKIKVTWDPPASGPTPIRYKIYRLKGSSQYGTYSSRDTTTSTYYNDYVYNTGYYWYKVSAIFSGGESPKSSPADRGQKKYPPKPTNVKATDGDPAYPLGINVTWDRLQNQAGYYPTLYKVYRLKSETGPGGHYSLRAYTSTNHPYYYDKVFNTGHYWYYVQAIYYGKDGSLYGGPNSGYKWDDDPCANDHSPPTITLDYPVVTPGRPCMRITDSKLTYDCDTGKFKYKWIKVSASDPSGVKSIRLIINSESYYDQTVNFNPPYDANEEAEFLWEFRTKDTTNHKWTFWLEAEDGCSNSDLIAKPVYTVFFPGWPSGTSGLPSCRNSYYYGD